MDFETNIFINCPFDNVYVNDLLKPILYVLIKNGLSPRLSLEISDSGQFRLEKINQIIKECKYSIHDLSKVKSTKVGEYARMNMPFELGIDYGIRANMGEHLCKKRFLILEADKYDYMKALSDINGLDVMVHENNTLKVIECLYHWISETLKISGQKPPLQIFYDYTDFCTSLFNKAIDKFKSERIASNYIEKISIPDFMIEIKGYKIVS